MSWPAYAPAIPVPTENFHERVRVAPQGLAHFTPPSPIDYDAASQKPNEGAAMGTMSGIAIFVRAVFSLHHRYKRAA